MSKQPRAPKYPEFGKRLTYYMAEKGVTPGELRRKMAVGDASTISRWRRGMARPEGRDLLRLAEALGVEVNSLNPGFAPPEAVARSGVMVLGNLRIETPYGATAREVVDGIDLSLMPPDSIPALAGMELAEATSKEKAMEPRRIKWWIEQAYAAGQRAAREQKGGRSAAGGAGGPGSG